MNIPEYITKEEVRRVCSAIGIRNWTALTEAKVKIEEAAVIQKLIGGEALAVSSEDFRDGLEVELEHGLAFSDANVTNNHPILTGKIVLAHLKETLDGDSASRSRNARLGRSYPVSLMAPYRIAENRLE
jgi:hypothetical protein